jgi:hypothetical protein
LSVTGEATFGEECTITSSKNLKFTEASATAAGDKGIIYSDDIGRVIFRRSSSLDPVVQLVNEVARDNGIIGSFQIQLSAVDVDFNTVSTGSIRHRVNGIIKTTLDNVKFLVSTEMQVDGDLIVTAPVTTETENNRVAFIEAKAVGGVIDYGTGVLSRGNLFYNNNSETLFCKNLFGEELV